MTRRPEAAGPESLSVSQEDLKSLLSQAIEERDKAREDARAYAELATAWRCRTSGAVFASKGGKSIAGSCPVHDATCPMEPL